MMVEEYDDVEMVDFRIDPSVLQRKLYFLNEQLQIMARDLPPKYQQRIPNELLCSLADSLVDNTVFRIVHTLMDIQHVTEKQLFHQRLQFNYTHSAEVTDFMSKRSNDENGLELLKEKHKKQLREFDKISIMTLDEKLRDQQKFLQKAGVPGFEVTDNPSKIQVQMRLLDFILRLSRLRMPD